VNVRAILVGLLSVPHTPEQAEHAAETVLDLHAHELAEQIRQHYGKPPLGGDHPENYPNGYNAGTHNAADFIDPKAQRAATTGDTT
jgi:hypothetical protein